MKKAILVFVFAMVVAGGCFGGWERTYGGEGLDYGFSVFETTDSSYIITGSTGSYGPAASDFFNLYALKIDLNGDTVWTRAFGGDTIDNGYSAVQALDGGYLLVGTTTSSGAGGLDVWLIKINVDGDTLWTRTYGGSSNDVGGAVIQTFDGNYLIAGCSRSFGAGGYDVYLIKVNSLGDTIWTRVFGGDENDYGVSVIETSDDNYIIVGRTSSFEASWYDVYLIKVSSSGDTLWTRTYGGTYSDYGNCVTQTFDGGYIITE